MNWFRRLSAEKEDVDRTVQDLNVAVERRRSALRRLMKAIDDIPLDDGLVKIGDDLIKPRRGTT